MTSRVQFRSFLFTFCVFLGSFRLNAVNGNENTDMPTTQSSIQFNQTQPINPTEGSFVLLNEQIIQITIGDMQCLSCVITIITTNETAIGRFVDIAESLLANINEFEYNDVIDGDIAYVIDELGGSLEYSQPVIISNNNQTINSVLNILVSPINISASFQSSSESNCRQTLNLLTDTSIILSENTISITIDQPERLPEVMVHIVRQPLYGTLKDITSNVSLPEQFSYTLFLETQIEYVFDNNKIQQSLDSFDVQFMIGHGVSTVVTVIMCIKPLPYPMITILENLPVYILGTKSITKEYLKASQSHLLDTKPEELIFDIIDTPQHGLILDEKISTSVSSIHSFTQKDILEGKIIYVNKRSADGNMTDRFQFRLRNKYYKSPNIYTVLISLMENKLTITNKCITVTEGGNHVITPEELFVTAPDGFQIQDIYLLDIPKYAEIVLKRPPPEPALINSYFSLQDIESGYLNYNHSGADVIMDLFIVFFVAKKPGAPSLHLDVLVNVSIIPVNDNPPSIVILRDDFYVVEGSSRPLTTSYLKLQDNDYGFDNDYLIYSFYQTPFKSFLFFGELCLKDVCSDGTTDLTWHQSDMMNGDLVYRHSDDASSTGSSDFILLTVSDGELTIDAVVFVVNLTSVMPIRTGNDPIMVDEDSSATLTASNLNFNSVEGAVSPNEYHFTITQKPELGDLYNILTNKATNSFTQEDINNNIIQYRNYGSNLAFDSFMFKLKVRSFQQSYFTNIIINPVNDDIPQLIVNNRIFVDFLNLVHLNRSQLIIYDSDTFILDELEYVINNNVQFGILEKRASVNDNTYHQTQRFTQKDINDENIRYRHTHRYTGPGNFTDSFTFTITDQANEVGPFESFISILPTKVPITVNGASVLEGGTITLSADIIDIHHPYFAGANGKVSVFVLAQYGTLKINGLACEICDFHTNDLIRNKIQYTHSGGEELMDSFQFFIDWPGLLRTDFKTFNITIIPVNDQGPSIITSSGLIVWATQIIILTQSHLLTLDADTPPSKLVYQFNLSPSEKKDGHFSFQGKPQQTNLTFTQQDIDSGLVTYVDTHDYEGFPRHLMFTVTDGDFIANGVFNVTAHVVTLTKVENRRVTVNMGSNVIITQTELSHVTNNQEFDSSDIFYYVEKQFNYGHLVGTDGQEILLFTQADINSGIVMYTHLGVDIWEPTDVATITVYAPFTLSNETIQVYVDIVLLNQADPLAVNTPLSVVEGGTVCFNNTNLDARNIRYNSWKMDTENTTLNNTSLDYVITTPPSHGSLLLNGNIVSEFNHNDLISGLICYHNDGSEFDKDTVSFDVVVSTPSQEIGRVLDVLEIYISLINDQLPRLKTMELHKTVINGFWYVITVEDLCVIDNDNTPQDITYTIDPNTINSDTMFRLNNTTNINTFTQADINSGNLMLMSNKTGNTSFTFQYTDTLHTSDSLQYHITGQEHELELLIDKPLLKFYQNEQKAIINNNIMNTTTNGDRSLTIYDITTPPLYGVITVNGIIAESFSQIDIDKGRVCYRLTDNNSTRDHVSLLVSNMEVINTITIDIIVAANGIIGQQANTPLPPKLLVQLPVDIIILQELTAYRDIRIDITSNMEYGSLYLKYPNTDAMSRSIKSFQYIDLKNGYIYYKWNPSTDIIAGHDYTEDITGIVRVEGLAPGEFSLSLTLEAPNEAALVIESFVYPTPTPLPTNTDPTDSLTGGDSGESSFNLALYIPLLGMIVVALIAFIVVVGFCCSQCKHIKQKLYHKTSAVNFNRASPTQRSISHRHSPTRPPHSPPLTGGFDQEYSDSEQSSTPDVMMVQTHAQQQPLTTISASHTYLSHSPISFEPTSSGYHTQLGGASPTLFRHQESPGVSGTTHYPPVSPYNILTRNELRSSSPVRKVSASRRNTRQYSSMTISGKGRNTTLTRAKEYALHTLQSRPQVEDSSSSIGYETSSLTQDSSRLPSVSTPTPINLESLINQEEVTDLYRKTHPVLKPSQYWV